MFFLFTNSDRWVGSALLFGASSPVRRTFQLTAVSSFVRLAPLLEKEASATDPGRVVNISSVAGLDRKVEGTGLSSAGV